MTRHLLRSSVFAFTLALGACASTVSTDAPEGFPGTQVHYLEIVTPEVDATCETYAEAHGLTFGEPEMVLGGARTAPTANGGMIGVRAPMGAAEAPLIRAYLLVEDIDAAFKAATESGAQAAHPPLELAPHGSFAIYIQGGVQHALWEK